MCPPGTCGVQADLELMDMAEAQILPAMLEVGERVLGEGGGQGWEARRHPSTVAAPPTWNVAKPSTPQPAFDVVRRSWTSRR